MNTLYILQLEEIIHPIRLQNMKQILDDFFHSLAVEGIDGFK